MHNRNFLREKFYVICFVPLVIATKSAVKKTQAHGGNKMNK